MGTTVGLPDELLREARARAAREGRTLTSLLAGFARYPGLRWRCLLDA